MNEAKTENLVRHRLRKLKYYDNPDLVIEEKQSDSPKIKKLLQTASKKGSGAGYPEFIIRSVARSDLVIVIECKADVAKHESDARDRYSDFAVDGALLYGSHLAKDYDVIVIGVSGQTLPELRISHFLYLKTQTEYTPFLADKLLSFDDYYTSYIRSPQKFNQDYKSLLDYSQALNRTLHKKKIKESQRSLLISGILIALRNKAFRDGHKGHKSAKQLAKNLIETIANEMADANLPESKIANLKQAFSFVTTHTTLTMDKEFFENLISEIDEKINSFMRTHQYFDTLGQFYVEFLRYANNDKGLGIVLTPPHITELFVELAEVTKDSVVVDNCCGTGGFLISAIKRMVSSAQGDSEKIDTIRKNQIVGIEFQDDIYALAISNMMIHEDGKSNIYQGDCFTLVNTIKERYKPNIGLLNPPYKAEADDVEELEFVVNNLEMLEQNGKCVAIVPLSCVLADEGSLLQLKEKLLRHHTLEAVMSMPSELFHNSKIAVVTCVVVFTAGIPHPAGKKTWFGYWRDDGFEKVKGKGRIDSKHRWEGIKNRWLNMFKNREVEQGLSVMQEVAASDEWCAEAFLETDYSGINKSMFVDEIKKYVAFNVLNKGSDR